MGHDVRADSDERGQVVAEGGRSGQRQSRGVLALASVCALCQAEDPSAPRALLQNLLIGPAERRGSARCVGVAGVVARRQMGGGGLSQGARPRPAPGDGARARGGWGHDGPQRGRRHPSSSVPISAEHGHASPLPEVGAVGFPQNPMGRHARSKPNRPPPGGWSQGPHSGPMPRRAEGGASHGPGQWPDSVPRGPAAGTTAGRLGVQASLPSRTRGRRDGHLTRPRGTSKCGSSWGPAGRGSSRDTGPGNTHARRRGAGPGPDRPPAPQRDWSPARVGYPSALASQPSVHGPQPPLRAAMCLGAGTAEATECQGSAG